MGIHQSIQENIEEFIELRRTIHRNPELSFQEFQTTDLIERKLQEWGIRTIRAGLETGLFGIIEGDKPGKTIALRADMDALPVDEETELAFKSVNTAVSHSCGHDIHTAILLGCAKVLSENKDQIAGKIKLVFQPAEERMGGAKQMIAHGLMSEPVPEAILGCHCWPLIPAGTVGYRRGPLMASSDEVIITIKGKPGHAAHPHKCVDPIVVSAYLIAQMQTIVSRELGPVDSAVLTFGQITGGSASNIIPKEVVVSGTIRTINPDTRAQIHERIRRMAVNQAASMNASCQVVINKGTPPVISDDEILDLVEEAVQEAEGIDGLIDLKEPSMGSEDFAFYLEKVPGAFLRIGTSNEEEATHLPLHNPGIVFDERSISVGIEAICTTALKFLDKE